MHGAAEEGGVEFAFYEVILCTGVNHAEGERFVIDAAEDQDRHVAAAGEEALEGLEALAVGEAEIKEDDIDLGVGEGGLGFGEAGYVAGELELIPIIGEQFGDKPDVAGIVLDEEDFQRLRGNR
jgi:hypothetical protein